jgi:membrane fusion protein (multidrug efflux system)
MPIFLKNALIIPQKATFDILDKKFVFVVDKNNLVRSTQITVGQEMPHLYVVTSGIDANDKIILEGLRNVKNNDKIKSEFVPFEQVLYELNHLHAE